MKIEEPWQQSPFFAQINWKSNYVLCRNVFVCLFVCLLFAFIFSLLIVAGKEGITEAGWADCISTLITSGVLQVWVGLIWHGCMINIFTVRAVGELVLVFMRMACIWLKKKWEEEEGKNAFTFCYQRTSFPWSLFSPGRTVTEWQHLFPYWSAFISAWNMKNILDPIFSSNTLHNLL